MTAYDECGDLISVCALSSECTTLGSEQEELSVWQPGDLLWHSCLNKIVTKKPIN